MVISIVLTIGYVLDGREAIQSTILEIIWNFLAIITWQDEFSNYDASSDASKFNGQAEFQRNAQSAMAMGSLCIITGLFYMADFGLAWYYRGKIQQEDQSAYGDY